MKVAIAGSSGFVGRALGVLSKGQMELIGLSRRPGLPLEGYTEMRTCDLFSRGASLQSLEGIDMAVYLVHSMMPSARLTQASFEDLDLLCALNFAEACAKQGVQKIVYLGGLLPESGSLSTHLESRREVEDALKSTGVPVIALRAGLVLGREGSSFKIVRRLVERLPWMICPSWTKTLTQPIDLRDVVDAIVISLENEKLPPGSYDLGVPKPISYLDLLKETANQLNLRRTLWTVPVFSARLSRRWVCVTTETPFELVAPLIESLREPMLVNEESRFPLGRSPRTLDEALTESCEGPMESKKARGTGTGKKKESLVRSVQRMTLPQGKSPQWAAKEYLSWLPRSLRGLILVRNSKEGVAEFILRPFGILLLVLQYSPAQSTANRALFRITGGLLARGDGDDRFEFRAGPMGRTLLTAIHDFSPRLQWWIYRQTQARFHLHVMKRFSNHLKFYSEKLEHEKPQLSLDP